MGGILSDKDILREIAAGNIILHDPDRDCKQNIQNCSVDITLGPYYYRNIKRIPYFNPWCADHVQEYWGDVRQAETARDAETAAKFALPPGARYIILSPGESILGHTQEFVGGLKCITCMVKARSSMGRCNVTICRDAGHGDINYFNRWCLEITNNGTCPLVLPVGSRIGQIVFFYTGIPNVVYSGKYQSANTLQELVANWNPTMLLPKAYLDKQLS